MVLFIEIVVCYRKTKGPKTTSYRAVTYADFFCSFLLFYGGGKIKSKVPYPTSTPLNHFKSSLEFSEKN